jgi:sigma-B regulation protein RsbU (phosphoserine phosphatase)
VAGDRVSKFNMDEEFPNEPDGVNTQAIVGTGLVLVYLAIGIAMVVVAFRRFRSYEIGFRLAVIAGVVAGILFDIETYLSMTGEGGWQAILTLLLVPVFVGGALIVVWAVSESVVRETWKEKFVSLDLLSRGHIVHSRIGSNVVHGIVAGIAAFAGWLILVKAGDSSLRLWLNQSSDMSFHAFDIAVPSLYILSHGLYSNVFLFAIFVLFLVSLLHKYIASPWLLVLTSAVIMALLNLGHIYPIPAGLVIQAFVASVSIWVFYRYDALAALLSMASFYVVQETAGLFSVGNPVYASSGFFMLGLFGFVLAGSVAMLYRKEEITDFDDIVPAFVRHISERQRMQQELEIARAVQMSFLPKANPVTSKLDIASRCAPALEVGGDYYDFIQLADQRLGVAVGDVSGKGTQAAFFMTLTKGFLNALAHVSNSPSEILTQVNKLFYESVERGMFISMVYGIFDTRQHMLTLARAGHNPVIMRKSKATEVQVVNPMGLALGLDEGETFSKSIQEVTINFQSGDLFVFYTDGFPEAMNKTMEEFGEERLCKTVEKYAHGTAAEIMDGVFVEMKQFTGKAKQHDDMTIVVIKVV